MTLISAYIELFIRGESPGAMSGGNVRIPPPMSSIVHAKVDYCNSLLLNIDVTQIYRLQAIQNALARAVTKTPKHHHITPVLKKIHWLKIHQRIEYKIVSLTYNTLQSSQPSYLRQL